MTPPVYVRQTLTEDDIVEVAAMWTRSAAWLRSKGLDQWQSPVKWENIRSTVADGTCWLVTTADRRTIGTITVESIADPYWLPSDHPDNALYVHRMVVDNGTRATNGECFQRPDWIALHLGPDVIDTNPLATTALHPVEEA